MRLLEKIAVLGGMTLAMTACGKKGALVYPDMLVPSAPSSFSVVQSGSFVKLHFDLPTSDRAGNRLNDLAGLKVSKRERDPDSDQICRSCMEDYRLFRKLYLEILPDGAERYGNRLIVLDGDVRPGKTYTYFAVPFTKEGVDGAPSPQMSVQLVQTMLPPILHAESNPTEIRISFVSLPPLEGVSIGYNLYRRSNKNTFPQLPVNKELLTGKEFVDSGLARKTVYFYMARTVVRLTSGTVVESAVSNEVEGMLKEDE